MAGQDVNVRIGAKEQVSQEAGKASKAIRDLEGQSTKSGKSLLAVWSQATIVVAGVLKAWGQLNQVMAQADQAYRKQIQAEQALALAASATGQALGLSAQAMTAQAQALSQVTQFGDEAILAAQGVLAQFGRIGGETMPRATEAVLDLAGAMGKDAEAAAKNLGRALAEPERAAEKLREAGVLLSESQSLAIKSFVEAGDSASAMGLILEQVETQFGGFAAAIGQSSVGVISRFENLKGDILEKFGEITTGIKVDMIETITPVLEDILQWLTDNAPTIYAIFTNIGPIMRAVGVYVVDILRTTFKWENYRRLVETLSTNVLMVFGTVIAQIPIIFGAVFEAIGQLAEQAGMSVGEYFLEAFKTALEPIGEWMKKNIFDPLEARFGKSSPGEWMGLNDQAQALLNTVAASAATREELERAAGRGSSLAPPPPAATPEQRASFAELAGAIVKAIIGQLSTVGANLGGALRAATTDISDMLTDVYGDVTLDFTAEIEKILEAGRIEFTAFRAREKAAADRTAGVAASAAGQPGVDLEEAMREQTRALLEIMAEQHAAELAQVRRLDKLSAQWAAEAKQERDAAFSLAMRVQNLAAYGEEYVRLAEERVRLMDQIYVLSRQGFDNAAGLLREQLDTLEEQLAAIERGETGGGGSSSLSTALGGMDGMIQLVTSGLGGFAGDLVAAAAQFGWMGLVAVAVQQALTGLFNVVGPLVNRILQPLANFLQMLGAIVGQLLVPVLNSFAGPLMSMLHILSLRLLPLFSILEIALLPLSLYFQILQPILQAAAIAFEVLMSPVRYLADLFSWVVAKIRYAVLQIAAWLTHPLNEDKRAAYVAAQGVSDPGRFTSTAFTGLAARIEAIRSLTAAAPGGEVLTLPEILDQYPGITEWTGPGVEGWQGGGVHGGNTTVTQPPDIYIHIHIGEGGVALMGDRELRQVGEVVVRSVEEVLGTGGRVSWLPAGA